MKLRFWFAAALLAAVTACSASPTVPERVRADTAPAALDSTTTTTEGGGTMGSGNRH